MQARCPRAGEGRRHRRPDRDRALSAPGAPDHEHRDHPHDDDTRRQLEQGGGVSTWVYIAVATVVVALSPHSPRSASAPAAYGAAGEAT